ncbi:MAG: hypothetical protein IJ228_05220 [Succinivibrio sp.]|nr:hypothetical protein [Succinivibrio sp.]
MVKDSSFPLSAPQHRKPLTLSALDDFKLLIPSDLAAAAPDFMIKADDDPAPLPQAQTIVSPAQLLTYRQIAWPSAFDFRLYVSLLCRPLYLSHKEQGELSQGAARFILESQFAALAPYPLHIDEPYTFNEKMQWYKLHYRNPLMTVCADKLRLREYVRDTLGTEASSKIFPSLLGTWERADDIDFAALPVSFVLKVNHGNAQNILVRAKQDLDLKATRERLNTWLKPEHNHYYAALEWCYKDIKPAILCEEFLELGHDLPDYKFFCFHGEPRLFYIAQNRFGPGGTQMDFYDLKGDHLPFTRLYPNAPVPPKKPQHLDRMLDIARALARPFPFVRVDFFDTPQGPLLGELTFYPGNGTEFFDPLDWDYRLGSLLTLS